MAMVYGYDSATKRLYCTRWYTAHATASDGIDFLAGDTIIVMSRDNDGAPSYYATDTIASVATDGSYVVLTTGLSTPLTAVHHVVILQSYTAATAVRQAGVSFQGDGAAQAIAATARLHRYQ